MCAQKTDVVSLQTPRDCLECEACGARLEVLQGPEITVNILAAPPVNTFAYLGSVREIPVDSSRLFHVGNQDIAVFRTTEQLFALKNQCPHHGFDLHTGQVENGRVRCSGHGFLFDLRSGQCDRNPGLVASTYDLKIEGDDLFVRLP
jgi:nitrite reductase/ring-hydroxylating ferredoxin subunit